MPGYQIPPWIKAPDVVGAYSRGYGLGQQSGQAQAHIAMEQARLSHQSQVTGIEIQLKQQQLERESIQKQQELEVAKHYHDEMTSLKQQELADAEKKMQDQAKIAAQKSQAFLLYQHAITPKDQGGLGMDQTKAMMMYGPGFGAMGPTSTALNAINKPAPLPPGVPVQASTVVDKDGNAIPGFISFLNASRTGYDVRSQRASSDEITPKQAVDTLKGMAQWSYLPGVNTNSLPAFASSLQQIAQSGVSKKVNVPGAVPLSIEGKKKEDLVSGQTYQTARGAAVWDGSVFKPITVAAQPADEQLDSAAPGQTAQNAPVDDSEESTDETE